MSHLAKICIFPIKSLDGVEVDRAVLSKGGALVGDREFAILDKKGKFVNGKRTDRIHKLRTSFDLGARIVKISIEGKNEYSQFHLDEERELLAAWLSDYFGYAVTIAQNLAIGFPDDTNAPGPTIVSIETLKTIVDWFPELNLEEVRRRFRTNLEIDGVPAFWEDRLFTDEDRFVPFQVGDVNFLGSNPCQRCVVITRNPQTGESYPQFQKQFILKRQETLPAWANSSRFNHFYRLTINTKVAASEENKQLKIGDAIEVLN
jgi:uncharacterized protein YcbX